MAVIRRLSLYYERMAVIERVSLYYEGMAVIRRLPYTMKEWQ